MIYVSGARYPIEKMRIAFKVFYMLAGLYILVLFSLMMLTRYNIQLEPSREAGWEHIACMVQNIMFYPMLWLKKITAVNDIVIILGNAVIWSLIGTCIVFALGRLLRKRTATARN